MMRAGLRQGSSRAGDYMKDLSRDGRNILIQISKTYNRTTWTDLVQDIEKGRTSINSLKKTLGFFRREGIFSVSEKISVSKKDCATWSSLHFCTELLLIIANYISGFLI